MSAFSNSGQVCLSLQRLYVQEAIFDEFLGASSLRPTP